MPRPMSPSPALALLLAPLAGAFVRSPFPPPPPAFATSLSPPRRSVGGGTSLPSSSFSISEDAEAPSDYDPAGVDGDPFGHSPLSVDENSADESIRRDLKRELMMLASVTDRGQFASAEERDIFVDLVVQLEALNPSSDPALNSVGEWDLALSSVQPYRSSPFFLAVREVLGPSDPTSPSSSNAPPRQARAAETGFSIHDLATSVGRIGRVRQTISRAGEAKRMKMVSEVDLEVGVLPGLPVQAKGTVQDAADLEIVSPEGWACTVVETKVTNSNVPVLASMLEDGAVPGLPIRQIYESTRGAVPKAGLRTFYLDDILRITRDVDDNFYVWVRA